MPGVRVSEIVLWWGCKEFKKVGRGYEREKISAGKGGCGRSSKRLGVRLLVFPKKRGGYGGGAWEIRGDASWKYVLGGVGDVC